MSLTVPEIDYLRDLVAEQSGNVVAQRQAYLLEQRLSPLAKSIGLDDVSALVGKLKTRKDPRLQKQIAEAVTVNETSFFRDMHPFETLKKSVLPKLIEENKATKSLNIWCAACSSGQEPYSIAMVIREHFPELANWQVKILATDLSEEMLEKTRCGEFTQLEVNRGLPVRKLVQFFDRQGTNWTAKQDLKSMIDCRRLNLTKSWASIGKHDLVFMRNVLIYFDKPTKEDILCRTGRVIKPHGYFFLGSSETTIGFNIPFKMEKIDDTICYRPTR